MTFLGWLSDPFKGLSDLQLGDEKVTLNHLVPVLFFSPVEVELWDPYLYLVFRGPLCGRHLFGTFP